jgi:Rap1a immunity proteins
VWSRQLLALGLVSIITSPCRADLGVFEDGFTLRYECQGDERFDRAQTLLEQDKATKDVLSCLAYIKGVMDGIGSAETQIGTRFESVPYNIRMGQAEIIVRRYLEDHPELLHRPAIWCLSRSAMPSPVTAAEPATGFLKRASGTERGPVVSQFECNSRSDSLRA